jgi:hypothetical protein
MSGKKRRNVTKTETPSLSPQAASPVNTNQPPAEELDRKEIDAGSKSSTTISSTRVAEKSDNYEDTKRTFPHFSRPDLLSFLDSLYAGAIALGVTRCIEHIERLANLPTYRMLAWGILSLIAALMFILDDWRYARWVNEDYGFRLERDSNMWRFWCECASAISAFFLLSTAFTNPIQFCFWFMIEFLLGFIWALLLCVEVRRICAKTGIYPEISLCLTKKMTERLSRFSAKFPGLGDYRLKFIMWTHPVAVLVFLGVLLYIRQLVLLSKENVKRLLVAGFTDANLLNGFLNTINTMTKELTTLVPLFIVLILKLIHHYLKREWADRIKALGGVL